MPRYTNEQIARMTSLPSAMLMTTLVMGTADPMATLRDLIHGMRYFREIKDAYPENIMIQGMLQDAEDPLPGLHFTSMSDREAILRQLHDYIQDTYVLIGDEAEAKEFKACLAALVEMIEEDVRKGNFGSDTTIKMTHMEYLRALKKQFSLPGMCN